MAPVGYEKWMKTWTNKAKCNQTDLSKGVTILVDLFDRQSTQDSTKMTFEGLKKDVLDLSRTFAQELKNRMNDLLEGIENWE